MKTPLPHQLQNVQYALKRRVTLIADPPGLGKTFSAILVCNEYEISRVLIVCPASLKLNWKREWQDATEHKNLSVGVVMKQLVHTDVIIINYEQLKKYNEELSSIVWDVLILDEAHYCKNPDAVRSKCILGHRGRKKTDRFNATQFRTALLLTGTPVLNRPVDLWNLCRIADPSGLGKDYMTFTKRYCGGFNAPWGYDVNGQSNIEELSRLLRQRFMIVHDKGILNLPAKLRSIIQVQADKEAEKLLELERKLYDKLNLKEEHFFEKIQDLQGEVPSQFIEQVEHLSKTRQQVALKKLPQAISFIEDFLVQGQKVVVFCYHKVVAQELEQKFKGKSVSITGATPQSQRQSNVDKFQTDDACKVFIGQIKAAGVGHTLTKARIVVFVQVDYVPANMLQAQDRVYRISQDRPVNIYYIVLQKSVDADICMSLRQKQAVIDKIMKD